MSDDAAAIGAAAASLMASNPTAAAFTAAMYHPWTCLSLTMLTWVLLSVFINPIYCTGANIAWHIWRRLRPSPKSGRDAHLALNGNSDIPWGTRLLRAYATLIPSKQAYWRRLLRSFIYYVLAVVVGFYFLLTHFTSVADLYTVYTPGMELAFCGAATHFLFCCVEDWPCRAHMGRTRREQLVVFWGYIFHHFLTAGAYLSVVYSHELSSMCLLGLTFEGPVLFGCLREVVALYDEEFDLFSRVPGVLLQLNWICAFVSLIPCRFLAIGMFLYSAAQWREQYLEVLVSPGMQVAYWVFGGSFSLINVYFTWLLSFWFRQDRRYQKKKEAKRREKERAQQQQAQTQQSQQQERNQMQRISYSYVDEQQPHQPSAAPLLRPLSPMLHHGPSASDLSVTPVNSPPVHAPLRPLSSMPVSSGYRYAATGPSAYMQHSSMTYSHDNMQAR